MSCPRGIVGLLNEHGRGWAWGPTPYYQWAWAEQYPVGRQGVGGVFGLPPGLGHLGLSSQEALGVCAFAHALLCSAQRLSTLQSSCSRQLVLASHAS